MAHTRLLGAAVLAALLTVGGAGRTEPAAVIVTDDPAQRELAEWALSRFEDAGLELPPVVVRFPGRDQALCDGAPGRAYLDADPVEVRMCWNQPFILLHELAHVWEAANVPEERHDAFMAMRGLESWAAMETPWDLRGREHAANVIAWGLLEDPYPVSRTYPNDPKSMTTAFELLTGTEPLHDGGPGVIEPDRSLIEGRSNTPLESGR